MELNELDFFIPHQANIRIIDSAAKRLHMPMEKVFVNLHKYGNTSAASVAIAWTKLIVKGVSNAAIMLRLQDLVQALHGLALS